MRLLILTQKVDLNDDLLGFMHSWINEFAKYCEKVTVICLQKGEHNLPENVKVLSLGKEQFINLHIRDSWYLHKIRRSALYLFRFYRCIWQERKNYDNVFVHMNKEYVLLGGLLWRLWRKKIVLWYAHYLVNTQLKIAVWLSHQVVTSTGFACGLKSKKLRVVGQGIDTTYFRNLQLQEKNNKIKLLFLGRISLVKDLETLIRALVIVKKQYNNIFLNIVGAPAECDNKYFQKIKILVEDLGIYDNVKFWGRVSNRESLEHYNKNDIFINLTRTGSFDKTTLEAMACEKIVVVCNRAFENIFPQEWHDLMIFKEKNSNDLANKILAIISLKFEKKDIIQRTSRKLIIKKHSLKELISKILNLNSCRAL